VEKEENMKTRRTLSTPAFLTALVPASIGLVSAAALAQSAVARNSLVPTSTVVDISGTVTGSPESVVFTGPVEVSTRPASGRIAGARAHVVVTIDLRQLSGRGLSTGTTYVSPGQANLTRVFGPSDLIEVTFPFFPSGGPPGSPVRTGVLTFALAYDVTTGALTAAVATVAAPNLPN
jgi:hypothetical protein